MKVIFRFFYSSYRLAVLTLLLFAVGCQSDGGIEMTTELRDEIVQEITYLMEAYSNAALNWDTEAIDSFWGSFEGFVFAGDGVILGGHNEWSERLRQYGKQVDRWLKFEYNNMHIEALSVDVATVTTEFEHSRITVDSDTINVRGAWTNVFKRSNGKWDVAHTNGTHVEY